MSSSSSGSSSSSSSRFHHHHRPAGVSQFHSHRPELLPERRAKTLFVGNLDKRISEYHLIQLFSPFGSLARVQFFWHHYGEKAGQPRSFAFVEFEQQDDAEEAILRMNGAKVCAKIIVVSKMKENTEEMVETGFRTKKTHYADRDRDRDRERDRDRAASNGNFSESSGEKRGLLDELREGRERWSVSEKIQWIEEKLAKMKSERELARQARQAFSLTFFDENAPSHAPKIDGHTHNSSSSEHSDRSRQHRSSRSRSPAPSRHSSSERHPNTSESHRHEHRERGHHQQNDYHQRRRRDDRNDDRDSHRDRSPRRDVSYQHSHSSSSSSAFHSSRHNGSSHRDTDRHS